MLDEPEEVIHHAIALIEKVPSHLIFPHTSKAFEYWKKNIDRTMALALIIFAEKHGDHWPIDLEYELAENPALEKWGLPKRV